MGSWSLSAALTPKYTPSMITLSGIPLDFTRPRSLVAQLDDQVECYAIAIIIWCGYVMQAVGMAHDAGVLP